jgi:hypothetical protein
MRPLVPTFGVRGAKTRAAELLSPTLSLLSLLLLLLLAASPASCSPVQWLGTVSSAWDDGRNWNSSTVPRAADSVLISIGSGASILLNATSYHIAALIIGSAADPSPYQLMLSTSNASADATLTVAVMQPVGSVALQLNKSVL